MHREGVSYWGVQIGGGPQSILEQDRCGSHAGAVSHDEQWVAQAQTALTGNLRHQLCEETRWQRWLPSLMERTDPWRTGKLMLELSPLPNPWPYEDFGRQLTGA